MHATPKPDPDLDFRMNSRGALVIIVLRVKDVMTSLRCSRSRAYEIIRECRGEVVASRLAFILPSQLRDWALRQVGGKVPEIPSQTKIIVREPRQSELDALKTAARDAGPRIEQRLQMTMPRTKPRKPGP